MESVNEFMEWMKTTLEEAKAALVKSKDDMTRYYNQRRTPAPEYKPRDRVYLVKMLVTSKPLDHHRNSPINSLDLSP